MVTKAKKATTTSRPAKGTSSEDKNSELTEENDKAPTKKKSGVSTFQRLRGSRKARLWFIGILLVIIALLFIFWTKARIILAIAFVTLLAAFGLEASQNDWDLGELLRTKSFEEAKVTRDDKGDILFDKMGNITTDKAGGKKADDYNCDDFTTNPEAQSFFKKVGGTHNDLNRLDGDKDGEACESLPQN